MPSIRVRRSAHSYTTVSDNDDAGSPRQRASTLNYRFSSPTLQPTPPQPTSPRQHISLPTIGPTDISVPPARPRPRAHTVSRIHSHCTRESSRRASVRHSRVSDGIDSVNRTSYPATSRPARLLRHHTINMESSQENIIPENDNEESGLSRPPPQFDGVDIRTADYDGNHHDDVVEHLDVIDHQIATVSGLTNAANSILIPPLSWYSRKPVLFLPSPPTPGSEIENPHEYADSLDRHVDDCLKRPSKFKRTMKGIWSFLKTPMGIITGIYGFLVIFWGGAIVVFLAKIINLHNEDRQGYWVEVCSQIENGLFTVTGIGLIPTRAIDTYRVAKIWRYKRQTARLRSKAGLPQLYDVDDLPDPVYDPNYVHVLTDEEQKDLHKQQVKFQHHQTWYRAHGTETHRAFPINIALLICLFNDGNSFFQIILCGTMWGLNRFERPAWSTGLLVPCSFLCGMIAAGFIWRTGHKTRRTKEVEGKLRKALAMQQPISYEDVEVDNDGTTVVVTGKSSLHEEEKQAAKDEIIVDEFMTIPPTEKKEF